MFCSELRVSCNFDSSYKLRRCFHEVDFLKVEDFGELQAFSFQLSTLRLIQAATLIMAIGNLYIITAVAVVGGGLFGIRVPLQQHSRWFAHANILKALTSRPCRPSLAHLLIYATSIKVLTDPHTTTVTHALALARAYKVASLQPCQQALGWELFSRDTSLIFWAARKLS